MAQSHRGASPAGSRGKANRTDAGHIVSCVTRRLSVTLLMSEAEKPLQTRELLGAVTGLD